MGQQRFANKKEGTKALYQIRRRAVVQRREALARLQTSARPTRHTRSAKTRRTGRIRTDSRLVTRSMAAATIALRCAPVTEASSLQIKPKRFSQLREKSMRSHMKCLSTEMAALTTLDSAGCAAAAVRTN